jgi:hypothetical protein
VEVNGGPGALDLDAEQRLLGVCALEVAGSQISSINAIVNPEKLAHLGPATRDPDSRPICTSTMVLLTYGRAAA